MLPPPMQSSLPVGWLASTGRELNPLDRYKRFQIILSSPFSGFILAQRKFQLEMGGKNALVVLADADLTNAVECAVNGASAVSLAGDLRDRTEGSCSRRRTPTVPLLT